MKSFNSKNNMLDPNTNPTLTQILKERARLAEAVENGAKLAWRRTPGVQWKLTTEHEKIGTCDIQNLALATEIALGPIFKYCNEFNDGNGLGTLYDSKEEADLNGKNPPRIALWKVERIGK